MHRGPRYTGLEGSFSCISKKGSLFQGVGIGHAGTLWASSLLGSFAYNFSQPYMKTSVKLIHARYISDALFVSVLSILWDHQDVICKNIRFNLQVLIIALENVFSKVVITLFLGDWFCSPQPTVNIRCDNESDFTSVVMMSCVPRLIYEHWSRHFGDL